jgi:hypothetical protein
MRDFTSYIYYILTVTVTVSLQAVRLCRYIEKDFLVLEVIFCLGILLQYGRDQEKNTFYSYC